MKSKKENARKKKYIHIYIYINRVSYHRHSFKKYIYTTPLEFKYV